MRRVAFDLVLAAGVAALGAAPSHVAAAATGEGGPQLAEVTATSSSPFGDTADLTLRYIQEDGPDSGHVRVVLVPETRPLTQSEARSAAQQAFLAALKEPGLGDVLTRITVVVRLMPDQLASVAADDQVIVFLHKGGNDWSVVAGE